MSTHETDPPVAKKSSTSKEPEVQRRSVSVVASGAFGLPSGATFLLSPGDSLDVTAEDAQWLVDNGLAE